MTASVRNARLPVCRLAGIGDGWATQTATAASPHKTAGQAAGAKPTSWHGATEECTGLQDAIEGLDQSPWQGLADFEALSGRNAHQTYLKREAAAFE